MRKRFVSILCVAVLPVLAMAQESTKLNEAFSEEVLAEMRVENQGEVDFLEFKAGHCYDVQDLSGKKELSTYPDVSDLNELLVRGAGKEVTADDFKAGAFNPLLYDFGADAQMTYYRVGDSGKLLKVYSDQRCRSLFNETK